MPHVIGKLWPGKSEAQKHRLADRTDNVTLRRFLPRLIDLILNGKNRPGKVFELTLPLAQVAEGYRAMDERRAIKTLLQV